MNKVKKISLLNDYYNLVKLNFEHDFVVNEICKKNNLHNANKIILENLIKTNKIIIDNHLKFDRHILVESKLKL